MRHFQAKKRWQFLMSSWPALFVLIIFLGFFAFGVFGFIGKLGDTTENKRSAQARVDELKDRKQNLEAQLTSFATEEGRERILRQDFGLAKAGEGVVVLVDEEEAKQEVPKKGFFGTMKSWFK